MPNTSWFKLWKTRIDAYGFNAAELWQVVVSHPCVYARLAAIELIDCYNLEYDDAVELLNSLNRYMPSKRHIIVACDQMINALNRMIDEFEREYDEWQIECHQNYNHFEHTAYFSGR